MSVIRRRIPPFVFRKQSNLRAFQVRTPSRLASVGDFPNVEADNGVLLPQSDGPEAARWYDVLQKYAAEHVNASRDISAGQKEIAQEEVLPRIVKVFEDARSDGNIDLLAYISRSVERWLAMDPTITQLGELCKNYNNMSTAQYAVPFWAESIYHDGRSLDRTTEEAIEPSKTTSSYLQTLQLPMLQATPVKRRMLSQLWQSLANMIIAREEPAVDRKTGLTITACFVDILAQLHHNNAIPRTIYEYSPPTEANVLRRSPLLYCLSSHILARISHAAWTKEWTFDMAEYQEKGLRLRPPVTRSGLTPVGSGAWLDLVLWSCVDGGWISEASKIVSYLAQDSDHVDQKWSVVSWQTLCRQNLPHLDWTGAAEQRTGSLQPNQINEIGLIEMGARTISREVVLAILDNMVENASSSSLPGTFSVEAVLRFARQAQILLKRSDEDLPAAHWDSFVLRMLQTTVCNLQEAPEEIESILSLSTAMQTAYQPDTTPPTIVEASDLDSSAWVLGLQNSQLGAYARKCNEPGVLRSLEGIANVTDASRYLYIREFARELRAMAKGQDRLVGTSSKQPPLLHPQTSLPVLADLLEFMSNGNAGELGDVLFNGDEIDGGFVQPRDFAQTAIQPNLIEYAISSKNQSVLTRVVEQLQAPIQPEVVRSFLRYRVATHQWREVTDILHQLSSSSEASWGAKDAMVIAAYALQYSTSKDESQVHNAESAKRTLSAMLRGSYDRPRNPSEIADISQVKLSNQIKRILKSCPGAFFEFLDALKIRDEGRLSGPVRISPSAFNDILEVVVEKFGARAGHTFLEQWCYESGRPWEAGRSISKLSEKTERIVELTPLLIRSIIQPIMKKMNHHLPSVLGRSADAAHPHEAARWETWAQMESLNGVISQGELSLLKWAVRKYQAIGTKASVLEGVFPGASDLPIPVDEK